MGFHQPHDKQLFHALKNKKIARDAISMHLPVALVNQIDLTKLKLYKTKLVSPEYKAFEADLIYEIPFKNQKGLFLFHCEHQSVSEKYLSLRIWQYVFLLLMEYAENSPDDPLPIVYPMVFYTGEKRYLAGTSFFELFGDRADLARRLLLDPIHLVDVCRLTDKEIKNHRLFGLSEYVFKHKKTEDFDSFLNVFLPWLEETSSTIGLFYVKILLRYVLDVFERGSYSSLRDKIVEQLSKKPGDASMTIAQELKQMGREEGMQQGVKEGVKRGKLLIAENLLKENIDEQLIAKTTGLTLEQVLKMKRNLVGV